MKPLGFYILKGYSSKIVYKLFGPMFRIVDCSCLGLTADVPKLLSVMKIEKRFTKMNRLFPTI